MVDFPASYVGLPECTSNSPQQKWTDAPTSTSRSHDELGVVVFETVPLLKQHVNCRVTSKPTAMLKPSAITAKAKTACEALYSCSRGIMEVEHGYIWKVTMIGDAPILHFSCLWEEG